MLVCDELYDTKGALFPLAYHLHSGTNENENLLLLLKIASVRSKQTTNFETKTSKNSGFIVLSIKVEKISGLDLIPSPSPSVKIQIIGRKVYLR